MVEQIKNIVAEGFFEGEMKYREPMSKHTSLKIGGPADMFAAPANITSLIRLLEQIRSNAVAAFPLGAGTNVLVRDGGIEGAVICFSAFKGIEKVREDAEHVWLSVRAGTLLQRLVMYAKESGYSGIEGLAGIPGTVGGAIRGNAGSFGYEMKKTLVSVEMVNLNGEMRGVRADEIQFGYRMSDIAPTDMIVGSTLKLRKEEREEVSARVEHFLNLKRERQPIGESSAGCVFKNPEGLSAGKLIDEAGCKGMRCGDIVVSTIHANFFINAGQGCAADFMMLINEVTERVRSKCGITLELEIHIVGREC